MTFEVFEETALEIAETFPEDLFRELNGGIMVRRHRRIHPAAQDHDLFVLGEYHVDRFLGRFIVLYYGSFELCFGYSSADDLRAVEISQYRYQKQMQKDLTESVSGGKIDTADF